MEEKARDLMVKKGYQKEVFQGVFFSEISTPGRVGWGLPPSSVGVFQEEKRL